jgi:hypothetical protein
VLKCRYALARWHWRSSMTTGMSARLGIMQPMASSKPCVYVIELNPAVLKDKKFVAKNPEMKEENLCIYVGSTGIDPEVRFTQHLTGYKS